MRENKEKEKNQAYNIGYIIAKYIVMIAASINITIAISSIVTIIFK